MTTDTDERKRLKADLDCRHQWVKESDEVGAHLDEALAELDRQWEIAKALAEHPRIKGDLKTCRRLLTDGGRIWFGPHTVREELVEQTRKATDKLADLIRTFAKTARVDLDTIGA